MKQNKNLVIILACGLLLVLGLVAYLLSSQSLTSPRPYEVDIRKIETQSESSEVDSIEEDLGSTELENIDTELTDIERELNASP